MIMPELTQLHPTALHFPTFENPAGWLPGEVRKSVYAFRGEKVERGGRTSGGASCCLLRRVPTANSRGFQRDFQIREVVDPVERYSPPLPPLATDIGFRDSRIYDESQ